MFQTNSNRTINEKETWKREKEQLCSKAWFPKKLGCSEVSQPNTVSTFAAPLASLQNSYALLKDPRKSTKPPAQAGLCWTCLMVLLLLATKRQRAT